MTLGLLQSTELSDRQFEQISVLVKDLCGINLHSGKKELVRARLGKRLRTLGFASYDEYIDYIRDNESGDELVAMLDHISTNLTCFFREPSHFEYLRTVVLPAIVAKADKRGRRLRVWSAGCSSGEEPYSIAILLHEELPNLSSWDVRVLATDLSTRVLDRARQGIYAADRIESIPRAIVARYFTCVETKPTRRYQLNPAVRKLVTFGRLNLMESWPMRGPFDIVFCRNVMIYFDKQTQGRLIQRYWELLEPGGVLFLGHSESLAGVKHRFKYVEPTVYQKG